MGTPEFAIPGLQACLESGHEVALVITAPDKPQGRGRNLQPSPVKQYALEKGLPVLQPTNLKSPAFLEQLASYNIDLQVVVAFRMLPEVVWSMPPKGTFNLHASLLPQYRGAAPINWAVINGEKETGLTTFFIQHEIDTGNIILQEKEPIYDDDTAGSLHDRLMLKGAEIIKKTIEIIHTGKVDLKTQANSPDLKHAPKIFKEDCIIQWNQPAEKVRNFVRGLAPYPGAWTSLGGQNFKIYEVQLSKENKNLLPGAYYSDQKTFIHVQTADGMVEILELQPEGRKKMLTEDFLRGNRI
ncbi:MAG: methionyl-tRNA formyltransferase [Cyclobacteriaceae bacterium]|nr:methionyl-tRNA formyltransferase [Cyclobacteriaceae bacterium]